MSTRTRQTQPLGAAGNSTRRTGGVIERDPGGATVKGTGISFASASTIADTGNQLGVLAVGDRIAVRGSPLNSREWRVNSLGAGSIAVRPQMVQTENAGANITITRVD